MLEAIGTADELRALADLMDAGQPEPLTAASETQQQRIAAVQAHYPGVPLAQLAGRIFCDTPTPHRSASARAWHTIRNLDGGTITADMYLYGEIGEWGVTAADFVQQLASITATNITLYLYSPGGEVFGGYAIRNRLRNHPAAVEVRVDAFAASIATIVAMAGDRIVMNPQARMMIHDASGLVIGNTTDMRSMADVLDKISDDMAGVYATRAGGSAAEWRKRMKAETWFSAEEAVAVGLADEAIIDIPQDVAAYATHGQLPAPGTAPVLGEAAGRRVPDPVDLPGNAPDPGPDLYTALSAALDLLVSSTKEAV